MRYQMDDVQELTHLLLSVFTAIPQPSITEGLHRYLWRHARFGYAEQLTDALHDVQSGSAGDFLYHQKSGLLFAQVEFGYHQLFLAHLCALHKTDFSREQLRWNVHLFHCANPIVELADDCVREGYGLFLSSFSDGKRITVGQTFNWEPFERAAFGNFELDVM
jgi:hypothetical protein